MRDGSYLSRVCEPIHDKEMRTTNEEEGEESQMETTEPVAPPCDAHLCKGQGTALMTISTRAEGIVQMAVLCADCLASVLRVLRGA